MESSEFVRGIKLGIKIGRDMEREEKEETIEPIFVPTIKRGRPAGSKKGKKIILWTSNEDEMLTQMYEAGYKNKDIMKQLPGRTMPGMLYRVHNVLKLKRKKKADKYKGLARLGQLDK